MVQPVLCTAWLVVAANGDMLAVLGLFLAEFPPVFSGSNQRAILRKAHRYMTRANGWDMQHLQRRLWLNGQFFARPSLPRTFDEKFLWRKVFDHDPRFVIACDKLATKAWIRQRWPEVDLADTLWVGRDAGALPDALCRAGVVLKYNAGSGTNKVLDGQQTPKDMRALLGRWLRSNYGWSKGEWAYGPVRPRVFAEAAVFDGAPVSEIKVYMQGGFVDQVVMIYQDRGFKTAAVWEAEGPNGLVLAPRRAAVSPVRDTRDLPDVVAQALDISRKIGAEFDHMRLDFMTDLQGLVLGELTVYNLSGRMAAVGLQQQSRANRHWDLRRSWFANQTHGGWMDEYVACVRRHAETQAARDPIIAEVPAIDRQVFDVCYEDFAPE